MPSYLKVTKTRYEIPLSESEVLLKVWTWELASINSEMVPAFGEI